MRTKAEVRAFLDAQVGSIPQHPAPYGAGSGQDLSGQCVTGIKVLMDFIGVPNPYAARGNAINVNDTLLLQGIAQSGNGWLTIVVNRDMGYIGGVHYGHIWIDLFNEANYETNGQSALHTTKNTRPISQGQQFVNLDNYILEDDMKADLGMVQRMAQTVGGRLGYAGRSSNDGGDLPAHVGSEAGAEFDNWYWSEEGLAYRDGWLPSVVNFWVTYKDAIEGLQARPTTEKLQAITDQLAVESSKVEQASKDLVEAQKKTEALEAEKAADTATGNSFLRWLSSLFNNRSK